MKRYLASAMFLLGASVMSAPVLAADPMGPAPAGTPSAPVEKSSPDSGGMTKDQIIGRSIVDKNGAKVGTVKDVKTDAQGAATDLVVSVGKKDVLLPTSEVVVASNDTIQTNRSAKDMKRLPAASGSPSSGSAGSGTAPGSSGGASNSGSAPGGSTGAPADGSSPY